MRKTFLRPYLFVREDQREAQGRAVEEGSSPFTERSPEQGPDTVAGNKD